jgi:two-component system sensor histidine kinase QseC
MKSQTLTRKLFLRITPIILAVLAIIGGLAFYSCQHEINHVYDTQLINNANVLWTLVYDELKEQEEADGKRVEMPDDEDEDLSAESADVNDYGDARMYRIWKADAIVMQSDTALPKEIPRQPDGFSNVSYNGDIWRTYTMRLPHMDMELEVGEKMALRNALVGHILVDLFLPLLVLVPLIGAALWLGITSGLDVTRAMVRQIQSRSPDDLSPIEAGALPRDLAPIGSSINKLFSKLSQSLNSERRFSDHAAHQLRTPLAGSKLLIQMLGTADSDAEREQIIADLADSNERASQLVGKLLVAARVSHQPMTLREVRLYDAVAIVIADMGPVAAHKQITISLDGAEDAQVRADDTLLSLMISNLLENAIKYTPVGGFIAIEITDGDDDWLLSMRDNGPGISDAEKALVFQRFYRIETPEVEGAGLGLAIVADIVERLGGTIGLRTPADGLGLLAEVTLPRV